MTRDRTLDFHNTKLEVLALKLPVLLPVTIEAVIDTPLAELADVYGRT